MSLMVLIAFHIIQYKISELITLSTVRDLAVYHSSNLTFVNNNDKINIYF